MTEDAEGEKSRIAEKQTEPAQSGQTEDKADTGEQEDAMTEQTKPAVSDV